MKVKNLIEQLKAYDAEDEIAVAYWDKETVETYVDNPLTNEEWEKIVYDYEDGEWGWQGWAADTFVDLANESPYRLDN